MTHGESCCIRNDKVNFGSCKNITLGRPSYLEIGVFISARSTTGQKSSECVFILTARDCFCMGPQWKQC